MYYTFYPHQILLALPPKHSLNSMSPQYLHSYHPGQSHYYFSTGLLCEPPKWVPGSTLVFAHCMLNTEHPVKNMSDHISHLIQNSSLASHSEKTPAFGGSSAPHYLFDFSFYHFLSFPFPPPASLHSPPPAMLPPMACVLAFLSACFALSLRCSESVFPHVFCIFAQMLPEHITVNGKHNPPWILPIQLVTLFLSIT